VKRKPMTNLVVCSNYKIFRRYWESFYKDNPQFKRGTPEIGFIWLDSSNRDVLSRFSLNRKADHIHRRGRDVNIIFLKWYQPTNPKTQYYIREAWLYVYSEWKTFGRPIVSDKLLNTDGIDEQFSAFTITDAKNMLF
jgi:hypothetical protein